ncbi:AgmX/PglI C-terminal domain-containing protein [Sorangium sp. So ce145]|uniref:AgmX/PglI C-terminal domain-containing protein n=1 Tax=Sorangium sp. So ce145 TaxID=3133285 RepID=UPI003F5F3C7A
MDTFKMAPGIAPSNPFLSNLPFSPYPAIEADVPADAPEGSYTYALVKSAPDVPADECETDALSLEVIIRWGNTPLHVAHLTPPRAFHVGEAEGPGGGCDFFLPAERLGAARAPLVLVGEGGEVSAVIPPGASGSIEFGSCRMTIAQAIATGRAAPCAELDGARRIALPPGARARLELGDFGFEVAVGRAGRRVAGKAGMDRRNLPFAALSTLLHVGLLGAMAAFMPPLAMADDGGVSAEQAYLMAQAIGAIAEKELPEAKDVTDATGRTEREGGSGAAAMGESGKAGSETSRKTGGRFEIQGPKDNRDVRISRAQALDDAARFGMIGVLHAGSGGDPNALSAPWGGDDTLGNGERSVIANLWGETIDESGGVGGLGLTGVGEGGGGRFVGIGIGSIGTINHGSGVGDGPGFGPGGGASRFANGPGHKTRAPRMGVGTTTVSGRIPPEVIQRIVRQNFGRFRLCYENGLRNSPNLTGRVSVGFVIGRDGAVSSVHNGGSDLPDAGVVSCVVRSFYGLSFPPPDAGIVTVTYPLLFSPSGG